MSAGCHVLDRWPRSEGGDPSAAARRSESIGSSRCQGRRCRPLSGSRCAFQLTRRRRASRPGAAHPVLPHVPSRPRGARRQKTHDVGLIPATDQQAAALGRVANQLRDPADGLDFELGRGRREAPRAHVGVQGRRKKVAQDADRRRRRGDVAEEARMRVEQRVVEQPRAISARSVAGSLPVSGSGPLRSSAWRTADGDSSGVTGRPGTDASSPAIWSTSACPSVRNVSASMARAAAARSGELMG